MPSALRRWLLSCVPTCVGPSPVRDSDVETCGACGPACPQGGGAPTCQAGVCGVMCKSPLQDCGGTCVDVSNDPTRCGSCDTKCDAGQVCSDGSCDASC